MSVWLSADELFRLTRKRRYSAQRSALDELKIPFTPAANGEPLVKVADLDAKGKPVHRGHRWDRIASVRNLPHAQASTPPRPRRA